MKAATIVMVLAVVFACGAILFMSVLVDTMPHNCPAGTSALYVVQPPKGWVCVFDGEGGLK